EKFVLEYEPLRNLNPKLIYASLLGWGRRGPDKNNPAYDSLAYWARAGLGYMFTAPGMPPPIDGGAFGDNVAALGLAFGIMLALYVRERTGLGQEVDTSLFHTGIYQASFWFIRFLRTLVLE
ncbi:MAG: CoA transferase, partial [Deltaproteobacteria bacterium]|nr:CoA transferase [Deltaproteobacteria bacterium]